MITADGASSAIDIPAATATNTVVKSAAGVLVTVIVTDNSKTNSLTFKDSTNASGNAIFSVPGNASVGDIFQVQIPCANGISVVGDTNAPGVTVTFA